MSETKNEVTVRTERVGDGRIDVHLDHPIDPDLLEAISKIACAVSYDMSQRVASSVAATISANIAHTVAREVADRTARQVTTEIAGRVAQDTISTALQRFFNDKSAPMTINVPLTLTQPTVSVIVPETEETIEVTERNLDGSMKKAKKTRRAKEIQE